MNDQVMHLDSCDTFSFCFQIPFHAMTIILLSLSLAIPAQVVATVTLLGPFVIWREALRRRRAIGLAHCDLK
jgi:hypothetical protein